MQQQETAAEQDMRSVSEESDELLTTSCVGTRERESDCERVWERVRAMNDTTMQCASKCESAKYTVN